MRALALLLALCAGCATDPCDGIDGTCVALHVDGSGPIDALAITLSGAASGTQVVPEISQVASLPVAVALSISQPGSGSLQIYVEGVYLGSVVGVGETAIDLAPHASATVVLEAPPDGFTPPDLAQSSPCGDIGCARASARLYAYLCPSFNSGACTPVNAMVLGAPNAQCAPLTPAAVPGSCYDTGLTVLSSTQYTVADCGSCTGACVGATKFTTPDTFDGPTYFPRGLSFYCQQSCPIPASCP